MHGSNEKMVGSREENRSSPNAKSINELLFGIWSHLSSKRRIQLVQLLVITISSGVAEVVSLSTVIPFLSALTNPESMWSQSGVRQLANALGLKDEGIILFATAALFSITAISAAGIRMLNIWLNGRVAAGIGSDLSSEVYKRTLYQPYEIHVQRNSSDIIAAITTEVGLTESGINIVLQVFSSTVVSIGLIFGLFAIEPSAAIGSGLIFGTAYGTLAIITKRRLRNNGQSVALATRKLLKSLQEGLGGIRDVLLDGTQMVYVNVYEKADRRKRILQANSVFLSSFPKYTLEAFAMVAIAIIATAIYARQGNYNNAIPVLGAIALGSQRLLPALQQIYGGWAALKNYNSAITKVLELLEQPLPMPRRCSKENIGIFKRLEFRGVHYTYNSQTNSSLSNINFSIEVGDCIGIIGATGSGKSTLLDLAMGLLLPTHGAILVNGIDVTKPGSDQDRDEWTSMIAHVPQNIYLADTSISENIAFGIPSSSIDYNRVYDAAKRAKIADFIESDPEGYNKIVGERGIRLSGGQKQRIGIARALYKNASVLILDEATSALDGNTEQEVMESINLANEGLTMIIVAHRISTLYNCNRILELNNGKLLKS